MTSYKGFSSFALLAAMTAVLLTGCGAGDNSSTANTADQSQTIAEAGNTSDYSGKTIIGKVTKVDDNEITVSVGGGPGGGRGDKGEKPELNKNSDNTKNNNNDGSSDDNASSEDTDDTSDKQTPPELPDNNNDSQTPPDNNSDNSDIPAPPDNNSDGKNSSDKKNGNQKRENKTVTITIDNESVLQDIELSDITEGSRITVSFDDSGNVSSVAEASDKFGPGGKGERPNDNNAPNPPGKQNNNDSSEGNAM